MYVCVYIYIIQTDKDLSYRQFLALLRTENNSNANIIVGIDKENIKEVKSIYF